MIVLTVSLGNIYYCIELPSDPRSDPFPPVPELDPFPPVPKLDSFPPVPILDPLLIELELIVGLLVDKLFSSFIGAFTSSSSFVVTLFSVAPPGSGSL